MQYIKSVTLTEQGQQRFNDWYANTAKRTIANQYQLVAQAEMLDAMESLLTAQETPYWELSKWRAQSGNPEIFYAYDSDLHIEYEECEE